jgi:ATP-dependent Clp protease ATP-binding subunit ClpC
VGKTELAIALAEFMFGERDALIRLDMSEYGEKFNISRLTGAPPGYIGHDEGGQLTEKVRRRPYSVVLFDELEKAHPDIYNILLQILDDGRLTDSYGRVVNFKNVIIIMTSNLSSRVVGKGTKLGFQKQDIATSYEKMKETITGELKKSFSPEFLSRITETIVFKHLEKKHIMSIVDIHLTELNKQLIEKGLTIEITREAKDWLALKGYNISFGARPLRQTIQKFLEDPLSDEMLKGKYQEGGVVEVGLQDNHLIFIEKPGLIKSLSG